MENGQEVTLDVFIEECWDPVTLWYQQNKPFTLKEEGDGTPGPLIWSEHDLVFQVALLASKHFGRERIHMEVQFLGGKSNERLDLVITDHKPRLKRRGLTRCDYDLAVEFKIVSNATDPSSSYHWRAVERDALRLQTLLRKGTITAGVACIIDKIGREKNEGHYEDTERTSGRPILRCYDR